MIVVFINYRAMVASTMHCILTQYGHHNDDHDNPVIWDYR